MTLEDFFTLTELKDGLTSPARVNELIAAMQKEKDYVERNVGDTTRQWSTVANTIAATENKDCLDLFVQLDGLWFIERWLNDVQKFGNDTGNNFVEESTAALLRALERLQIDNHRLVSSGIERTVQNLLGHSNSVVQDKAKALCDRWMQMQDADTPQDDGTDPSMAISPSHRNDGEEKNAERSRDDMMPLVCFDSGQQVNKEETTTADKTTDLATTKQEPTDPVDPPGISRFVGGDLLVKFETTESKSQGTTLTGTSGSTPTVHLDVSQLDRYVVDAKDKHEIASPDKAGGVEMSTVSGPLEQGALPSSADVNNVLESAIKTDLREDTSDKDEEMVDTSAGALQDSPGDNCKWGVAAYPKTYSNTESDSGADDAKKHDGARSEDDSGTGSHFSKPSMNAQGGGVTSKGSDMELDYGMVDPLEVARRVAIEVEREVDSRERSCSTSEKMSGGEIEGPKSPNSTNGKEGQPIGDSGKEVLSGSGAPPEATPSGAEHVNDAETLGSDHKHDLAASQITEVAQESEANTKTGFSGFDLNQEVCSEEIDRPMDSVSTPISVVSASRAVVASVSPVAPLQFEGTLGWRGSAATSAFRRIPDGSFSGTHNSSKQRLDCLNIDLNVAEDNEDKIEDYSSRNKIPIISSLPSGEESSIEACPRRSVRLQLDLNSLGDGSVDTVVLDWRRDGRVASLNQNGRQSPSQSSSSSSMQPSVRNIDLNLNDQPIFPNDASSDHHNLDKLFNNSSASRGVHNRDESVISLFGSQVEVNHKDVVPQSNGRILEPAIDFGLGKSRAGWGIGSSMALYGHNGFPSGPPMYFSSPYVSPGAPSPYMVDSRGVPVAPQFMGSSSALPPAFSQQPPPFIMNMAAAGVTGTSFGSNGAGPSQHNFDLNSGFMMDGGNRENSGGLRQLFNDKGSSVDERYLRTYSSSVVGGKRQEPDGGWEGFPISYKHQPPPWK